MKLIEQGLNIEESFEMVLLDYIEYEVSVYRLSIEGLIRGHSPKNSNFFDKRRLISRTISNFLSSSRAYTDQIEKLKKDYPDLKNKTTSHEYDTSEIYRFVCKLRNYVQHYDVVIHKKSIGSFSLAEDLAPNNRKKMHNTSLQFIIKKRRLKETTIFTNAILEPMPDEILVTKTLRQYLASLQRIHEKIRSELDYKSLCLELSQGADQKFDERKIEALLGLMRKNHTTEIIGQTNMIGVR